MGEAVIRSYRGADRVAVIGLWSRVFPDAPPRNAPDVMLDTKVAEGDGLIWVAEAEGSIVGAVMAGYDGVRGWIYHLGVDAAHRGRGVGAALVRAIEAEMLARGCTKLNLQVRTSNLEVVAFYERLGFAVEPNVGMGRVLGTD